MNCRVTFDAGKFNLVQSAVSEQCRPAGSHLNPPHRGISSGLKPSKLEPSAMVAVRCRNLLSFCRSYARYEAWTRSCTLRYASSPSAERSKRRQAPPHSADWPLLASSTTQAAEGCLQRRRGQQAARTRAIHASASTIDAGESAWTVQLVSGCNSASKQHCPKHGRANWIDS